MRRPTRELPEKADVLEYIKVIREASPPIADIFLNGACYRFYVMLQAVFPKARPFFDMNHVITEIPVFEPLGAVPIYFDITGEVQRQKHSLMDQSERDRHLAHSSIYASSGIWIPAKTKEVFLDATRKAI